jgi:hypothetical protein
MNTQQLPAWRQRPWMPGQPLTPAGQPVPAIVYACLSKEDEKEHGAVERQVRMCNTSAEREGRIVAAVYSEKDHSGSRGNRGDELARAIAHAQQLGAEHGYAELLPGRAD